MNVLNFFYQNPPKITKTYNRKKTITSDKLIIKGAKGSGKKTLVFNHLQDNDKNFLYLDETDLRFDINCYKNLNNFIKNNNIKVLIINEYSLNDFIFNTNLEQIYIIVSKSNYHLDGFDEIWLDFLDFEEYLSSSSKNFNISMFFSLYILNGRMLKEESGSFLQNHLKINYQQNSINILKAISSKIGYQTSILWVLEEVKKYQKISKQSVFDEVFKLENEYMLIWVKNYYKNVKKPYFTNFALRDALCVKKDFKKTFENIVFCELLKFECEIFYTSFLDFYVPKLDLGIICEPFLDMDLAKLKIKKIKNDLEKLSVKNLVFITNNISSSFDGALILPFYEWALGLE